MKRCRSTIDSAFQLTLYAWDVLVGCRIWEWQWRRAVRNANGNMRVAHELLADMRS